MYDEQAENTAPAVKTAKKRTATTPHTGEAKKPRKTKDKITSVNHVVCEHCSYSLRLFENTVVVYALIRAFGCSVHGMCVCVG